MVQIPRKTDPIYFKICVREVYWEVPLDQYLWGVREAELADTRNRNRNFSFPCGHLWSSSGSTACLSCPRALDMCTLVSTVLTGCSQASDADLGGQLFFGQEQFLSKTQLSRSWGLRCLHSEGIWLCTMVSTTEGKSGNKSRRGDIISVWILIETLPGG